MRLKWILTMGSAGNLPRFVIANLHTVCDVRSESFRRYFLYDTAGLEDTIALSLSKPRCGLWGP